MTSSPTPVLAPLRLRRRIPLGSLHRNSLWIIGAALLNGALGYGYWVAVARTFAAADVGRATALIALMTVVSLVSNLGMGAALVQRLPRRRGAQEQATTLSACLLAGTLCGVVAATLVLALLPLVSDDLAVAGREPLLALLFVAGAGVWTASTVLDYGCIAQRASRLTAVRGAIFGLAKLPLVLALPAGLLAGGGTTAIVASWTLGGALSCALIVAVALPRLLPGARLRLRGTVAELRAIRPLLLGNHLTTLGNVLPGYLLPVVVVTQLSAVANAHFSITWAIGGVFFTISSATGTALFADGSHDAERLHARLVSAARLTALLLAPAMALMLLFGGRLLELFGSDYAAAGTGLLMVLTVAAIPDAVTNLHVAVLRVDGRLRAAAALTGGMALVAVAGGWIVAPRHGLVGVGCAWLLAQSLGTLWVAWDLRPRRGRAATGAAVG